MAKQITDATKIAAMVVSQSFLNGGNWGFLKEDDETYKIFVKSLKEEPVPYIKAIKIDKGVMFFVDPQYMEQLIASVETLENMKVIMHDREVTKKKEIQRFKQYLADLYNNNPEVVSHEEYFRRADCILYSTTGDPIIPHNRKRFRAFALTLPEVIGYIRAFEQKIGADVWLAVSDSFKPMKEVDNITDFIKGLVVTDSKVGAFLGMKFE